MLNITYSGMEGLIIFFGAAFYFGLIVQRPDKKSTKLDDETKGNQAASVINKDENTLVVNKPKDEKHYVDPNLYEPKKIYGGNDF